MRELYEILEVNPTATQDEIKNNYRRIVAELHPDKHPNVKIYTMFCQEVNTAYETLSDPRRRAEYDLLRMRELPAQEVQRLGTHLAGLTESIKSRNGAGIMDGLANIGNDPATKRFTSAAWTLLRAKFATKAPEG